MEWLLDGHRIGRTFEGIGAVSAGASSRLLIDYPAAQRSEILDYLFKPGFGASLQHLKVEIGGDVNSTDGTEPSHERVQGEENFHRGWEWWLLQEARTRNPGLILDSLAWGAPGWIGGGTYYSDDMAGYLVRYLQGAKREQGLNFRYVGVWNEMPYSVEWIKRLRQRLDAAGLQGVGIVAADEWDRPWSIAADVIADPEFAASVEAIGVHYPHTIGDDLAIACGKPLWASEDGTGGGTGFTPWETARRLARIYNRNYVDARITKTEIWSPVTAYYDSLPYNDSGLLRANTPWSGAYEVLPAIWVTAHTTQFAQPGWTYLDGNAASHLPEGGSLVTLLSPTRSDLSIIVETTDAVIPQRLVLHTTNGIPRMPLQVWRTRDGDAFSFQGSLPVSGDGWELTVEPDCIYTLTTTTGQSKGQTTVPAPTRWELPYVESFASTSNGGIPKGFMNQGGAFEVSTDAAGNAPLLRQVLLQKGIEWTYPQTQAFTLVGDASWTDYEVSVQGRFTGTGEIALLGRIGTTRRPPAAPNAYSLVVLNSPQSATARFEVRGPDSVLASGSLSPLGTNWHELRLRFQGSSIQAWVDEAQVASLRDSQLKSGRIGVGSGWHLAEFADLQVHRVASGAMNLAGQGVASASSSWSTDYLPALAIDGDLTSRWNSAPHPTGEEWIELDFTAAAAFNRIELSQYGERIRNFWIGRWDGIGWNVLVDGESLPQQASFRIPDTTSTRVRLTVNSMTDAISIQEFGIYADPPPTATVRISEWMLHNTSAVPDPRDGQYRPWFELWNTGALPVDLSGWHLSNDPAHPDLATLPASTVLEAGERRVVWCGAPEGTPPFSEGSKDRSVGFVPLENQTLVLSTPGGISTSAVELDPQPINRSQGLPDSGNDGILLLPRPSPATANTPLEAVRVQRSPSQLGIRAEFRGSPFTRYSVQSASDGPNGPWNPVGSATSNAEGNFSWQTDASGPSQTFLRATIP